MRFIACLTLVLILAAGCVRSSTPGLSAEEMSAVEAAASKVRPALVRIEVVNAYYSDGRARKTEGSGSGFIISSDGYIVTNHHVVGDSVRLICTLSSREEIPARLVGTDPMADIAVIQLMPEQSRRFPTLAFADSDQLEVGDRVLAHGSPHSLSQSVTAGIVSNTAMTMPRWSSPLRLDGENVGSIVRWVAHDAPIFPGNSGGPLTNLQGEVVGVNEISFGLGGAIPSNLARDVAEELIARGDIRRSFIGVLLQPVFKAEHAGREPLGVIVSDVIEDSPAEEAGLETGDRLLKLTLADGETIAISIRFQEELPPLNQLLGNLSIDEPITAVIVRDGEEIETEIIPEQREPVMRQQQEFKPWGITARNLSYWTALELDRPDTDGVLVTSVGTGGPAGQAKPELRDNDVLLEVDGRKLSNLDDLTSMTETLLKDQTDPVPALVRFAREDKELLTVVKVGIEDLDDPGRQVRKAWIPIDTQVLTRELTGALGHEEVTGVRVTRLYGDEESTETFGLRVGDLIVELDGDSIPAYELHHADLFPTLIRQYPIGSEVTLGVLRDGEKIDLAGELSGRPPAPREMKRYRDIDFEMTVRNTAYFDRVEEDLKDAPAGVMVDSVQDGGWAALGGLQIGDLLISIDGQSTPDVKAVESILASVREAQPETVIFRIQRDEYNRFLELIPVWDD